MEQSLNKYCILLLIMLIYGCGHMASISTTLSDPCHYETYAPVRESLSFINNSICIYTRYDINKRDSIVALDTCFWKYYPNANGYIILYRNDIKERMNVQACSGDTNLNFIYNTCPQWFNIKQQEFKSYANYKSPIGQDISISLPLGISSEERARIIRGLHPTFADKYGCHHVEYDTIVNYGTYILWFSRLKPLVLFASDKQLKEPDWKKELGNGDVFEIVTNSYEYINYKVNYEKKVHLDLDSIIGKQFSYIGDMHKKESIQFVNDSICTHSVSVRAAASSPFISSLSDTCLYSVRNNQIAIDLVKGKEHDTLTYSNDILFYSKVYRNDGNGKYTHIVKPFIDETHSCASKADSINMIMSTYFNVYVPINMHK